MSHRSSTNDRRHPYMVFAKVNKFWERNPAGSLVGYSQESKDYYNERLEEYRAYKWPAKNKKK